MPRTDRNQNAEEDLFKLSVDQYGRLWLHVKLDGIAVDIDLAPADVAFEIMASAMAEHGYEPQTVQPHQAADNDDEQTDDAG